MVCAALRLLWCAPQVAPYQNKVTKILHAQQIFYVKEIRKRREETHEMKAAAGNSNGAFLSFLPSAATLSSPPPSRARRTKIALRRKRGVSEDERKISFFVSSSSSSGSGSGSGSGGGKRNALREKERRKREEERRTKTTTGSKSGRKPARRANGGGKKRNYERELEDALRRHRASSSFSSPSAALEEGSEFGEKKPTAAAVAVKDTKRRVKKALKKAKRFAKRNVQKATDVLLPSRSSLGGGRGRGDGGPVRFTPSTPSSSTSYYAYRQQQPNIFGLTGAAGAIAGWSMLIGLAYVVVKVMNGERVIPRGGFQLNIPGLRGSNLNKRNSNEGGKWVIDRSLGGRKVWVPDGDASRRGSKLSDRSALDEVYYGSSSSSPTSSTSTKSRISRTIEDEDEEKEKQNLPTWWVESPFLRTSIGGIDKQRKADLLQDAKRSASYLSAARINGVQWTSDMILDFHTACATALKCYPYEEKNKYRLSIAKSVGPENARVQLYRQASEIAVEDCVGNRSGASSSFGMDVNIFVVGLSYFLNIPTKAAINIVRSSCAVKIRNLLLASCSALRKEREELTSPSADLLLSLFSIVSVLNVFPFTENSAEIEMINEGFKTRITEKERNNLLMAYRQISDGVGDRTIEEALR